MSDKNARPAVYLIGNAHIDPVWLWRWQEGFAEIKASFKSALDRMAEFPGFVFTSACASYYKWVEENDPAMFDEIRQRVAEGRWRIAGAMWIQPDCNVPSGESFARHLLYSQNYFLEKFGRAAVTGYNVDSFGHNASIPKILQSAGIGSYVMMRPSETENPDIPGNAFWWESDDGSRVLTFRIPESYNTPGAADGRPEDTPHIQRMRSLLQKAHDNGHPFMYFYGVGNHGGGPTISTLKIFEAFMASPGASCAYAGPDAYFDDLRAIPGLPVWKNELQHHASGCYSACSDIKRGNRRAENRLLSAEKISVMSGALTGYGYPAASMDLAWQNVLFNQFHDIMGGCSLPEAYADAAESHGEALSVSARVLNAAAQRISWQIDTTGGLDAPRSKETDWNFWGNAALGTPVVVMNPLAWPRKIPVQLSRPASAVFDDNRNPVEAQRVRASRTNGADKYDALFLADVPAMGWRVYWAFLDANVATNVDAPKTGNAIENAFLKLTADPGTGYIKLFDKQTNADVLGENAGAALVMDINHCDTWAHNVFKFRDQIGSFKNARVEMLENGPVRAGLRVTSTYDTSILRQDFYLYADADEICVDVKLDWRELKKMLKLSWPVNVRDGEPCYDIPFGHIIKKNDGCEEAGQMWFDLTGAAPNGGTYGLAVLNDGKYSFDVLNNDMRMTIANGSAYADHYAGVHFDGRCEYLDQGVQYFRYALMPHAGRPQDAGVIKRAVGFNTEETHINETYHDGPLPLSYEGIDVGADNIVVTAVKPAYDENGVVLRAYESTGTATVCTIKLPMLNQTFTARFKPYQIKTYRVTPDGAAEVNLYEK